MDHHFFLHVYIVGLYIRILTRTIFPIGSQCREPWLLRFLLINTYFSRSELRIYTNLYVFFILNIYCKYLHVWWKYTISYMDINAAINVISTSRNMGLSFFDHQEFKFLIFFQKHYLWSISRYRQFCWLKLHI